MECCLVKTASIDLGSNSTRLLIADVIDGEVTTIYKTHKVTKMAEGLENTNLISNSGQQRVLNTLKKFQKILIKNNVENVYLVGTAAMRDANNADYFLELIKKKCGFEVEVVTGEQEGVLTSLGVLNSFAELNEYIIIDIGGRSTEFITQTNDDFNSNSVNIGVVTLTEKFFSSLPISEESSLSAKNFINENIATIKFTDEMECIGVAGTFLSMASMVKKQNSFDESVLHGSVLTKEDINQLTEEILKLKEFEIFSIFKGIDPKRAPTITSGIFMVNELINRYNIKTIKVSNSDILEGLILKKY